MITVREIKRILPHRYPMLLLDRVLEVEQNERLTALKAITANEPWYRTLPEDATDEQHDYPPVLMVESWCQAAAVLGLWPPPEDGRDQEHVLLVAQLNNVEVCDPVLPGDVLEHRVRLVERTPGALLFTGESLVGDEVVLTVGSMMLVLRPGELLRPGTTAGVPTESSVLS